MSRTPPIATRRPHDASLHGETRIDEWHWLREIDNPEVLAHLHAENAHARAWLAPLDGLRDTLYAEMLARIQEDDDEVPWRKNGWWQWSRTETGRQYPLYLRRRDTPAAQEEVLLDLNQLAEGKPFLQLGALEVSPDAALLAYSLDETGALDYTLRVRDLASGTDLPLAIEKTEGAVWGNDSRTLYYLSKDEPRRTHRLWRHRLGQDGADELVFEEPDELFWLDLGKTRDDRWLVLSSASKDTTGLWVLDADDVQAAPRAVLPRRNGIELSLDHRAGRFYLLVNDRGRNFRLVETSAESPSLDDARELIAHRDDVMLEDVDLFARHMVVQERDRGVLKLRVWELASGRSWEVPFDESVYTAEGDVNEEFDTDVFRFEYTSLVTPHSVFDLDMASGERTLRKRQPVLGGYDPARYASEQFMARADDGTEVPVSLVYRRDRRHGEPQPLLMYGYGAYGFASDVYFSSSRLSLLDRGVVFAVAHVRGGGDRGRRWYDEGKLAKKANSFGDFVACAQALVERGWTSPGQLIVEGGSAGGLLVAASANLRPELFRAVVAEVPFVDVINTMLDETLPLTVGEFLEWGNPKERADYETMRRYSPYDNLRRTAYPAMYLRTSLNDSQVPYWEAAKYAARLRTLKTDEHPVLLSINMDAGHGGASGRYDALRERAEVLAFMLWQWGLA
ncbi:S9 family peptidase [Piscinibacter sp.]|uniref:S9 family peptidase n=1 Tax=Piscinibacter sp. TaxID=1903157 RepID=UPI001B638C7A|nr:S9 family peptidase [Piscinibacter sp.]MBP6542745.1 S9 family peptidase [Piscinibacter sp.]